MQLRSLLILIFISFGYVHAQHTAGYLSPKEAVQLALANNPGQGIIKESERLAQTSFDLAKGAFLPTLSASAGKVWNIQDVEQLRSDGELRSVNNARGDNTTASIAADWVLFDGLGMFHAYDRLRLQYEGSRREVEQEANQLAARVLETYYQYTLQRERVEVLEQTLPISRERRRLARDRYELGKSSKMEFLSAQVDFNTDSAALLTQQQALIRVKHALNLLLSRAPETALATTDTLTFDDFFAYQLPDPELLIHNPGLQAVRLQQAAATKMTAMQRAQRWPTVSATAGYNYINQNTEIGFALSNQVTGFTYGFTARWSIFNRFFVRQQIQQAAVQENIARLSLQQLTLDLQTAYADAYAMYRLQKVQAELAKENLTVAQQNAALALDRYKLGVSTSLELRVAQQNALQSALRLLNALYEIKLTEITLQALTGQLTSGM